MNVPLINPANRQPLQEENNILHDLNGTLFPKINGVFRFVKAENYTQNFGFQWNLFQKTQLDRESGDLQSQERFFAVTHWNEEDLTGKNVLEVGSGAGRFSQIVLDFTNANLYSVDYSAAVEANFRNNGRHGSRFHLFQASIYELPFEKNAFDKVFCFGVLQHTPDFRKSIIALAEMVKPGGELIVDFYPIRGWWTKIHAKYLFRPFTKRLSHEKLLHLIEKNADQLIKTYFFIDKLGIGKILNRFLPVCDIKNTLPAHLTPEQLREWVILDTFDMFSPEYDKPQRLETVEKLFLEAGMQNVKAQFVSYGPGNSIAVVKGVK